jgi:glycosyltransferase involved in cell wall biosynthesis
MLNITYYMPFKPLGHPNPSGDLMIGTGLFDFLRHRGHTIRLASRQRLRWVYWKPWLWLPFVYETLRIAMHLRPGPNDLWLTYHSYYKAPDILGALVTTIRPMPYFIFQGVYSTKRRRRWQTWSGFRLNRWALCRARAVFTNKRNDEINLKRLLPPERVHYIAPGVDTAVFKPNPEARRNLRESWQCGREPVVLAAAMFRPGVKTRGLEIVIDACHHLQQLGQAHYLVICGDGATSQGLRELAVRRLGTRAIFAGKVAAHEMPGYYSAADIFAFPGIREGLGMVYLEAQACGLPVVAYDRWGASEAVRDGSTGLLCPPEPPDAFRRALGRLVRDVGLRSRMGAAAVNHVAAHHDQAANYRRFENLLQGMVSKRG